MVKRQNKTTTQNTHSKGIHSSLPEAREMKASTAYGVCQKQLSTFGGILCLIEFLDLIQFETVLEHFYQKPSRELKFGHYRMIVGILMLLFIGLNRLWHFTYIRLDTMICGFFKLNRLSEVIISETGYHYVKEKIIFERFETVNLKGVKDPAKL